MRGAACLITGGTGFLGRHAVQALRERGSDVTIVSRAPAPDDRAVVGDLAAGRLPLGRQTFRHVYHLAGLAHTVPRSEPERRRFFDVNVAGTRHLLESLEEAPSLPEAFVLVSTVAVYGAAEGTLLDEDTPRRATDPYGASKRAAENLVLEWGGRTGVRIAILRLPLVVGRGAPGNLGRMIRALSRGWYLPVGTGRARRSMVLAQDVAGILPAAGAAGGTFHLTDRYHPSLAELETALATAMRRRVPWRLSARLAEAAAWAGDRVRRLGLSTPFDSDTLRKLTSTLTFSDERAVHRLGWRPRRVLDHVAEIVS